MAQLEKNSITKHQRGFFGRIWQIVFWLFQAAMIYFLVVNIRAVDTVSSECAEAACEAGAVFAGSIFAVGGWLIWLLGTLIFGILMLATRGKLVTYNIKE